VTRDGRPLAAMVAGQGLAGSRRDWPATVLTDDAYGALLQTVEAERITGHLLRVLESERLPVTDAQYQLALERHEDALARDLLLERLLMRASGELAAAGIGHRALKGPAVARTVYADPGLRSFGDIDILVRGRTFESALALLAGDASTPRYREPRRHFTARYGKGVSLRVDDLQIDLHRVFVAGPFGLAIDEDDLFAAEDRITVGDVDVPVLDLDRQFLHACYHATLGDRPPRLSALRDVAEFVTSGQVDGLFAVELAERWRARAVVQAALRLVRVHLGVEVDGSLGAWAARYEPDRFERAALRVYVSEQRSYAAQAAAGIWALPGLGARVSYAGALLFPSAEYLQERDGSYRSRWRRALVLARQWGPSR
jgi:hypothetical protein